MDYYFSTNLYIKMNITILIYIFLILLSLLTLFISSIDINKDLFISIILITIFIKAFLISDYFMELKKVRLKYRLIPIFYLLIILSSFQVSYFY